MRMQWVNIACVVAAGAAYWWAPGGYDYTFCMGIGMMYVAQNLCWLVAHRKENWMRFELLFMISFFFVNFAYPMIYAPENAHWSFFQMGFNRHVINQATAMAWLAYSAYMLGVEAKGERREEKGERREGEFSVEVFRIFCGIAVVGFALFVVTGGYTALKEVYSEGKDLRDVGIYSYFNNIFSIGALLMAATVWRLDSIHRRTYLAVLGAFVVILLSTGSRQFSISLVVILLVSYCWYIYQLKGWQVALILLAGAGALFTIMLTRSSSQAEMSHPYVSAWDMFEDLSINAINLYVLVDWGNSHDCTWLQGLLLDLVSPIPKLGTWVTEQMDVAKELIHGGDLPSYILLGRNAHWGTGTNMVGEAYRGFGIVGMCIIMWGIGAVIRKAEQERRNNIYWEVFYLLMVGHAVIYPRAPLLYDPRTIVWTMVLLWGALKVVETAKRRKGEKARRREGEKVKKVVYCIPGLWNAGGMERVLTQKVNWLSEHTDWEICIVTTEVVPEGMRRNYFPLDERVEVVELNVDFNADYRKALPRKWWNHVRKQRVYRKQLEELLRREGEKARRRKGEGVVCVSLCGKEIEWLGKAKVDGRKIAELHFAMDYREQWLAQTKQGAIWRGIGKRMTRALIRQMREMDKLVVLTRGDEQSWRREGVEQVEVIGNPCSIMPAHIGKHDKKQILGVGRLEAQKGFDWLIEAWGKIEKEWPEWTLRICGEGSERKELRLKIEDWGLKNRVEMEGLAEDLEGEYQRSGVFVLSSRYEGLPLALMEAMSCGTCCVAMDCKEGPRELIEDGKTGYLVGLGDVDGLAKAIAKAIGDEQKREAMGKAAADYARRTFALDGIMKKWIKCIEEI